MSVPDAASVGFAAEVGEIHVHDARVVPLNGVFRFAVWEVGERFLFAAAAHEDRGVPILLILGSAGREVASQL